MAGQTDNIPGGNTFGAGGQGDFLMSDETPPVQWRSPQFKEVQRELTFRFAKFRQEGRSIGSEEDARAWANIQIPRKGTFGRLRERPGRPRLEDKYFAHKFIIGHRHNEKPARAGRVRLGKRLAPYRLKLERTLGWGGNGVAALFYLDGVGDSFTGKGRDYFVAKCNINSDTHSTWVLQREKEFTARYRGALHVVQLKEWPWQAGEDEKKAEAEAKRPMLREQRAIRSGKGHLSTRHVFGFHPSGEWAQPWDAPFWKPRARNPSDVILLEYLGRGSLQQLITRMKTGRQRFPNRVLWLIWHCLVQSCIAMEYPPMRDHEYTFRIDGNGKVDGHPVSESVIPRRGLYPSLIHFDIDPQNVLLGDYKVGPPHDDHSKMPVLKVADFGLAVDFDRDYRNNPEQMWHSRTRAKPHFMLPEQFSEEWDYVPNCPHNSTRPSQKPKTAGRYGWETNLYQLALTMVCCIALSFPAVPPHPQQISIQDPADPTGQRRIPSWSYGAYLLNEYFNYIDIELRAMVAQSLCDRPDHRPRLELLKHTIEERLRRGVWTGNDADGPVAKWLYQRVEEPPAPYRGKATRDWIDAELMTSQGWPGRPEAGMGRGGIKVEDWRKWRDKGLFPRQSAPG